jgi:hypothetical protein
MFVSGRDPTVITPFARLKGGLTRGGARVRDWTNKSGRCFPVIAADFPAVFPRGRPGGREYPSAISLSEGARQ